MATEKAAQSEQCSRCGHAELYTIVKERNIPFVCPGCGGLLFKYTPLSDKVFIWVEPLPEKAGSIYLPDEYFIGGNTRWKMAGLPKGTVLAAADGYWHPKKRKHISRHNILKPGDLVTFNKLLLVRSPSELVDNNGNVQKVFLMGYEDIYGFVTE